MKTNDFITLCYKSTFAPLYKENLNPPSPILLNLA
jgi:hypothetical protein